MNSKNKNDNGDGSSRQTDRSRPRVVIPPVTDPQAAEKIRAVFQGLDWQVTVEREKRALDPVQLGQVLLDHCGRSGSNLLLLDAGLEMDRTAAKRLLTLMERLERTVGGALVLTALSNADRSMNPYAGLETGDGSEPEPLVLREMVSLLGPGNLHAPDVWPGHLLFFNAQALRLLAHAHTTGATALAALRQQGGLLLAADDLFIPALRCPMFEQERLDAHERRRPAAWGLLRQRLDRWLRSDLSVFAGYRPEEKPVTLHVSHSWGGGVARWVDTFIDNDPAGCNFQLRSEGPQAGKGAGQRLSLFFGNKADAPVARWWLQAPIRSTAIHHAQYESVVREIIERYRVGRIIVSSLVGHSLDILQSGVPTVQVLHDFYPLWPLLGVHPGPYLGANADGSLNRALAENDLLPDFADQDADTWTLLAHYWRQAVKGPDVKLVAPGESVASMIRQLEPDWEQVPIEIIPHGLPALPGRPSVQPREREDDRIRLVIPGRVQEGKGRDLLLEALPELVPHAHIYLVGAGKEGEVFFGRSGVDVILQYRNEDLPRILAGIGPHLAALLSVVPETFSYTLSEMQQLGIPVVATRVGSFAERVSDGETGWLIEPSAAALVATVGHLSQDRAAIRQVRECLAGLVHPDTAAMIDCYNRLCPAGRLADGNRESPDLETDPIESLAFEQVERDRQLRTLKKEVDLLQAEVDERTRWAEERQRVLEEEQRQRERHVSSLNQQLDQRFEELQAARQAFDRAQASEEKAQEALQKTLARLEKKRSELEHLKSVHEWVLASTSWRITRPFRVGRRMLGNFMQAQAWNPLRWPLLLSQLFRTLKTVGLSGALNRAQLSHQKNKAPERFQVGEIEEIGSPDAPESFPLLEDPRVSIVIPVHNKWTFTAACLRSLANVSCRASFEVIVVDDESSDESGSRLQQIENLVYLRNRKNLGFIGSCNQGAARARGEFLVMLNNDTQVLEGWLDGLLETFDRFPDTGLAGAVLIYPDGRLQEAGGIVFNDGSGWNFGRNDDPEKPEYQYIREVDYCSGACIMLRTEVFHRLDGFDAHYTPAYYEDTDLAFRIRQLGLKVRVQPRAAIIHHEGVSSGTDLASGIKRYQSVNREKFLQRWQAELANYPAPLRNPDDRAALRKARDHRLKGRILVIDAYTPEPDQDSGSLRLSYLMACMGNLGYGVTFFAENRGHSGLYTTQLQQAGVEVIYNPWLESLHGFFRERGEDFDFIMISRHYVAINFISLIERYCPNARFIFDTVDLHYLRETRLAELENSLPLKRVAAQTRRSELAVIEAADATLVVSSVEKTVLEQDAPGARVHVISNVHEVVGSQRPWSERKDIFFVGGYQHPPNVDAAIWFVESIWPLVREQLPDIRFHLIGSKANDKVSALHGNGVEFHGFVKSLEPWLDGCRLSVAPLRYGAGVKGKVNLSMSRGQPVVATPMAVEGMFVTSGKEVLVAETAEDFAAAIVRLYGDEELWGRISDAAMENVRQYFSVETARSSLKVLLNDLR